MQADEAELRRKQNEPLRRKQKVRTPKVRTPRRSCAALLRRLSGPPRFAWEKARLLQEEERLRKEEEKAAKKAKGSNSSSFEHNLQRLADNANGFVDFLAASYPSK